MRYLNRILLLFFEENEDPDNISTNLVRLLMNRFVIEEEKEYEIIGTFNLSKVLKSSTSTDRRMNKFFYKDYNFDDIWRKNSDKMFNINFLKDIQIISNALNNLPLEWPSQREPPIPRWFPPPITRFQIPLLQNPFGFAKPFDEAHIVIGTSIYMDHFNKLFNQSFWNNILLRSRHKINKLTLLNGWKKDFATKNQVRQDYLDSEKKYRDASSVNYNNPIYTSSVNDDFENMTSRIFKPTKFFSKRNLNPDLPQLGISRERGLKLKIVQDLFEQKLRNSSQVRVKTFLYKMLNDDEIDKQQSNEFQFMRSDCDRLTVSLD